MEQIVHLVTEDGAHILLVLSIPPDDRRIMQSVLRECGMMVESKPSHT